MPFYKYDNPKKPNIKDGCGECDREFNEMQSFLQCDNLNCAKVFHPSCKGIFGVHISRVAAQKSWFCCDNCGKNINFQIDSPSKGQSPTVNADFKKIEGMFTHITKQMDELMASQHFLNEQFEEMKRCNAELVKENSKLKKEVSECRIEIEKQRIITNRMEGEMDNTKQAALSNSVIIAGCPQIAVNNPKIIIDGVLKLLNVSSDSVTEFYSLKQKTTTTNNNNRAGSSSEKYSTMIVVKFNTNQSKAELMENKRRKGTIFIKQLEGCGDYPADKQIFIRDQLTPLKQSLFREARIFKNQHNFAYLWYKDSKICLRKTAESKVIILNNFNDLNFIKSQQQTTQSHSSAVSN